ncbi:hypothetical protein [Streptomyces sp. NPDC002851]
MPNGSTFDDPRVSAFLTAAHYSDRAVMTAQQVEVPAADKPQLWINGNSVSLGGDNASRFLVVRLNERDPETAERAYDNAELAWALLTLARGWILAGAPQRHVRKRQFTGWLTAMAGFCDWAGYEGLWEDHDTVTAEMDTESADFERLGLAVLDRLGDGWHEAHKITSDPVCQDLIPRSARDADKHIGHRGLGRNVLAGRIGRTDGTVRVERRWDARMHRFLYRWVQVGAAVVRTVRQAARSAVRSARTLRVVRRHTAVRAGRVTLPDGCAGTWAVLDPGAGVRVGGTARRG